MKTLLLSLSLLVAAPAFATGGFDCELSPGTLSTLNVSAGTSHMYGNPLLGDLQLSGSGARFRSIQGTILKDHIVNYKNNGSELYILALDNEMNEKALELTYNLKTNKGKALVNINGVSATLTKIKCEFE